MGLSGNLRTMDLPEILQWISGGRKTGTLHLERRSVQKRIAFKGGVIHTSWSNDPRESLGQFLIRERLVTEEQLFRALLKQETEGRLIGSILIAEGLLKEEALRRSLQAKAEETVYDLFLWPEGKFEFKDGEMPANISVFIDLDVTGVILEGVRRVDEWQRIKEILPSTSVTFRVMIGHGLPDSAVEKEALKLASLDKSLAEISMELRRSEFEAASVMFELHQRGLVQVDSVGEEAAAAADLVGTIKDLLSVAQQRLAERRYDAALRGFEEVLSIDRLNQHAKKGLIAVMESRSKDRALKTVPLDKVPKLLMDMVTLTRQNFDPQEGFVLSRVNGEWDVRSILKLCPMAEEDALLIFARLLERKVIGLN
jgi:hypothetical protein